MANEANVTISLRINVGNMSYQSNPVTFNPNVSAVGANGPTPGQVLATVLGTDVSLALLTNPGGLCRIMNTDLVNFVEVGSWDGTRFHPIMELLPGESWVFRLSRQLGNEYGTGTTVLSAADTLRIKADTLACYCIVEAFNK